MKLNYKNFPILQLVKEKAHSPFTGAIGLIPEYATHVKANMKTIEEFWKYIVIGIHDGTSQIDYITEPIRKLIDDDFKVGDKLHRERDKVHDASGIFLTAPKSLNALPVGICYLYYFVTDTENEQTYFTTLLAAGNMILAFELGVYKHGTFPAIELSESSFNAISDNDPNHQEGYAMQMALQFLMFKHCAELEIKVIDSRPNQTPSRVKIGKEKFLSEFPLPVTIINSTWFTKVIRTEGFKVGAHLRWQPYGPGRSEKKLIMIKEFQKHGYTRRAQIEN